jgi:hypothetical protein
MINSHEFLQSASRGAGEPAIRIAGGRRKPARNGPVGRSASGDFAQARLITDLAGRFALGGEEISAIMALIGQVRAVREMLRALLATAMRLPAPLRARLHAEFEDRQIAGRRDQ